MLFALNKNKGWRAIFGNKGEDTRLRDVELILRFFALLHDGKKYAKPMKTFLNNFMASQKSAKPELLAGSKSTFEATVQAVHESLGERPFHLRAGLNAAAFDAVFVAFAQHKKAVPKDIAQRFKILKQDGKFIEWVTSGTTDENAIRGRCDQAKNILFG